MIYADEEYYTQTFKGDMPSEAIEKALKEASRHIDILTYNRIVGIGFDNLTDFQKETIKECICLLADFEYENADIINSILSSYNINGVAMTFNGSTASVMVKNGICIKREIYSMLQGTGLTCQKIC